MPSRYATQALFNQLAKQNNLAPEWHLHISTHAESGVGSLKSTAMGCCAYALRRIWISEALLTHGKWETVKDVIAHEVAHALTPGAGHGRLWKLMATKLGAKPAARQPVGNIANLALAQEPKFRKTPVKQPKDRVIVFEAQYNSYWDGEDWTTNLEHARRYTRRGGLPIMEKLARSFGPNLSLVRYDVAQRDS